MSSIEVYMRRGRVAVRQWLLDPRVHMTARCLGYFLGGFLLSAASLANAPMPLALGLLCACSGWGALLTALGGCLGYRLFWATSAQQPILWLVITLPILLLLSQRKLTRQVPLLLPTIAALIVSGCGLVYQVHFGDTTALMIYLLRIGLAGVTAWLFPKVIAEREPVLDWIACGFGVLALAQVIPFSYLSLGYIAAGALATGGAFPSAAMAGLGLDLAQITPVPMTAVMALSFLPRLFPIFPKQYARILPGVMCLVLMGLIGIWDLHPVPGLLIGGFLGSYLPSAGNATHRRGETGIAQVRLEVAAGVLSQTEQLLLEVQESPVDEDALVCRAAERACHSCPCRKHCKDAAKLVQLPGALLHKNLLTPDELPVCCRKSGRFLAELHRSQEQLRSIRADRERQREYREAVVQQYYFLSHFLQDLSDQLGRRTETYAPIYSPKVNIYANRPAPDNGDRCLKFAGTGCKYYVLLCDGMGTGTGAVQEGRNAANMLQRLLSAGYPAEYALRTLNSLCALRGRAGAVTVDLLELQLETGSATIYKWGAAPSWLIRKQGAEKLGCAGPPPGLSVTDCQESRHRLRLRQEETLLLVSDGIEEEVVHRCCKNGTTASTAELSAQLLTCAQYGTDDATVISVELHSLDT